jgi:homoserine dehydrogenase
VANSPQLAERKGVALNYEAAVAGGIPVIKTLREALAGNAVSRVYGILNGTCNYILTRMEKEGLSFEACLKPTHSGSATPRPIRPSTSRASTPRTSSRS